MIRAGSCLHCSSKSGAQGGEQVEEGRRAGLPAVAVKVGQRGGLSVVYNQGIALWIASPAVHGS